MIHRTEVPWQTQDWQRQLAGAFTEPEQLFRYLQLDNALLPAAKAAARRFAMRVPRGYAALMEKRNPLDPLLRQVLPLAEESETRRDLTTDPVGDADAAVVPGLLHKYRGRALLITTGACGIHCRYCFRRHFPYSEFSAIRQRWQPAIRYLQSNADISEVILSGGDPLTLSDAGLGELAETLEGIPHLRRLRVHSRLPVVLPERVNEQMISWLAGGRLQASLVLHVNHPNELSSHLQRALRPLSSAGITLLNQSVLLRGVNDSADVLCDLSASLFANGILPYYLHLLDPVQGAAHFETAAAGAVRLHREMQRRLPGYLVPRMVRDLPGEESKTLVF